VLYKLTARGGSSPVPPAPEAAARATACAGVLADGDVRGVLAGSLAEGLEEEGGGGCGDV
jgi:hypothetical protein